MRAILEQERLSPAFLSQGEFELQLSMYAARRRVHFFGGLPGRSRREDEGRRISMEGSAAPGMHDRRTGPGAGGMC